MFEKQGVTYNVERSYNQKGSIILQNDIWIGENTTIMSGVTVRNGAVIARNSHVVSDVPPYAIVGGNPARLIGYRYKEEQVAMLQKTAWWDWDTDKLLENAEYFTEDVDGFCNKFFEEAEQEWEQYSADRSIKEDSYFAFVDFYENYVGYPGILESFLDSYLMEHNKKLILFIQEDCKAGQIDEVLYTQLKDIADEINNAEEYSCSLEIQKGDFDQAKKCFLSCSHYIVSRTYDAVYFSCLADKLGMEVISGVDSIIQYEEKSVPFVRADKGKAL